MQSLRTWFGGSATDTEPPASVLAEWNAYSATPSSSRATDRLLTSAEEGAAGVTKFVTEAVGVFNTRVSGAARDVTTTVQSVQFIPSAAQWTYFAVFAGTGVMFLLASLFVFLPLIILSPSKFALTFSLGSGLILASLGALKGWRQMAGHMTAKERLPFTAAYLGSLVGTIYAAVVMHSYVFSIIFCVTQIITLLYYLASYFPGGATGVQYLVGGMGKGVFSLGAAAARSAFSR
uniref:Vesicle transport protein n=1 Tax=Auxenochlorella protothecoides TaxID=3075 RepID=A0A1D2AH93_AUXPR